MRTLVVGCVLVLAACSSGVSAPVIGEVDTVCNSAVCVDVPVGWDAEVGETYLSFHHSADPTNTFLTVGVADMEAIVDAAGGTWPVSTEDAARAFWELLEEVDAATFERSARQVGGAIKTWGTHTDGEMWYLLYPGDGSVGVGIEMRAPNDSWETHADQVFSSVRQVE